MENIEKMQKLVDDWVADETPDNKKAVLNFLDSEAYKSMGYEARNRPFITSSKLKELRTNPFFAYHKYIKPTATGGAEKDYFVVGQAIDDLITLGQGYYDKHYEEVARRTGKSEKKELTKAQYRNVGQMHSQYLRHDLMPDKMVKENIIFIYDGFPCKAELDCSFDKKTNSFGDGKSTDSLCTFDPLFHLFQMTFYGYAVNQEHGSWADCNLYVYDKYAAFSRSHVWRIPARRLEENFNKVEDLLKQWIECVKNDSWPNILDPNDPEDQKLIWNSEFYPVLDELLSTEPTEMPLEV